MAGTLALRGAKKNAAAVIASVIGGEILAFIIKLLVHRPRPPFNGIRITIHRLTLSFPWGRVVNFMIFYGFLFALAFLRMHLGVTRSVILIVLGLLLIGIGPSSEYAASTGRAMSSAAICSDSVGLAWQATVMALKSSR